MYRFKRLNRGVAAGLIVLMVTCVYVFLDERSFRKDTDVIRGVVESYLKAGEAAAVYPEALQNMDRPLTREEKQKIVDKSIRTVNDYWTEAKSVNQRWYFVNKESILRNIHYNMFEEIASEQLDSLRHSTDGIGYVSKASFLIKEAEPVKKVASKMVMITLKLSKIYYFQGEIHTFGVNEGYFRGWFSDEEAKAYSQQLHIVTVESETNFYLTLTDSGWKIFEVRDLMGNSYNQPRPANI